MAAEAMAFADAYDGAYSTRHTLSKLVGRTVPLQMLTYSKQTFDCSSNATHTPEKRIAMDIGAFMKDLS